MASKLNKEEDINEELDEAIASNPEYKKSQALIEIANNTFRDLCKTLETEQIKLIELEERRKKLQEEMLRLKQEIDDEKDIHLNLTTSTTDNLGNTTEESEGESVVEFIERQRETLRKLHCDTNALELDTESHINSSQFNYQKEALEKFHSDLNAVELETESKINPNAISPNTFDGAINDLNVSAKDNTDTAKEN